MCIGNRIFLTVLSLLLVHPKRKQRKVSRVKMVAQIKYSRKARARPVIISPRAVFVLRLDKVLDPALQSVGLIFGGHQPQQSPRRLRRRARPLPLASGIVVASWRLAPPSILVLIRAKPAPRRLI